ncbi:MAG: hypothetical protein LPK03_12825, partial [Pontibacter sp.]|nr:hypothetical protein [Pontibacter sp.]
MLSKTGVPFSCPTCGHRLVFKSEMATALVCPNCQSINRRAMFEGSQPAKAEAVRETMSIIRVGTIGQYQGIAFEVLGRVQHFFGEGYRNHWYVLTGKGEELWLGEWAGNYSLFKEMPSVSPGRFNRAKPGNIVKL